MRKGPIKLISYLVCAKLKKDIDILLILKDMFEANDIGMAKRFMDFDFGDELKK